MDKKLFKLTKLLNQDFYSSDKDCLIEQTNLLIKGLPIPINNINKKISEIYYDYKINIFFYKKQPFYFRMLNIFPDMLNSLDKLVFMEEDDYIIEVVDKNGLHNIEINYTQLLAFNLIENYHLNSFLIKHLIDENSITSLKIILINYPYRQKILDFFNKIDIDESCNLLLDYNRIAGKVAIPSLLIERNLLYNINHLQKNNPFNLKSALMVKDFSYWASKNVSNQILFKKSHSSYSYENHCYRLIFKLNWLFNHYNK